MESKTTEPTVFAVDPDEASRKAIQEVVATMSLRCEEYSSGDEFLRAYDGSRPGCLVVDVKVPGVSGPAIQRHLAAQSAPLPIIFLSCNGTVSLAVHAMRAGAVHFIEKPFRHHDLWEVIHEAVELDRQRRGEREQREKLEAQIAALTADERRLLAMIVEGNPNRQVASAFGVCIRTVEIRRCKLMEKLDMESPTELLQFAFATTDANYAL